MRVEAQKLKMAIAYKGTSCSEFARSVGTTPQNLIQRIKRGGFSNEEMKRFAEELGGEWICEFRFPDGTRI